jgi:hypothetical protein
MDSPPRRVRNGPIPFLNDPHPARGPILFVSETESMPLGHATHLSTSLIDFLLQKSLPVNLSDKVLIGSSNALPYIQHYNQLHKNNNNGEERTCRKMCRQYQYYSMGKFEFIGINCTQAHFFVIKVGFDISKPSVFDHVQIYDSLRRTGRHNESVNDKSVGASFLRSFQSFLMKFAFFGMIPTDGVLTNPDHVLNNAQYLTCPQQTNGNDCGLFALAVVLHLCSKITITSSIFDQSNISQLRSGLHHALTEYSTIDLNCNFVNHFFPALASKVDYNDALLSKYLNETSITSPHSPNHISQASQPSSIDQTPARRSSPRLLSAEFSNPNHTPSQSQSQSPDELSTVNTPATNIDPTVFEDEIFKSLFVGKEKIFVDLDELTAEITEYETTSHIRVSIVKSRNNSRDYRCTSHVGCKFKANFGPLYNDSRIVLKNNYLFHNGVAREPVAKDGRKLKTRIKGVLTPSLDHITSCKDARPKPKDVQKTAANVSGIRSSYNQCYRTIELAKDDKFKETILSFQLIIPYLLDLKYKDPNAIVHYRRTTEKCLTHVFVCPGCANDVLKQVRPMISWDAAHLKSKWAGTLYAATVKTATDEIYPIAFCIIQGNEDGLGWRYFAENLTLACSALVMPHPIQRVNFSYFTIISDRDKGLKEAITQHFPNNHAVCCAVHLQRNVQDKFGQRAGRNIVRIAKTFSKRLVQQWLLELEEVSPAARAYVSAVAPAQWRSSVWNECAGLPPRYGIVTTNMSESLNSMLEAARDVSWLESIDIILTKIVSRSSEMRNKYRDQRGVIELWKSILQERWDNCAGFQVHQLEEEGSKYLVMRSSTRARQSNTNHTIDLEISTCTCGQWQEHQVPCVDACAYFRLTENRNLDYVMQHAVTKFYKYESLNAVYKKSFIPVIIDTLHYDGETLPPTPSVKRKAGRPKKQRLRVRHKGVKKIKIICQHCKEEGHNVRTCAIRKEMAASQTTVESLDLS